MLLLIAAVVPSLVLMIWFHRRDAFPEPQAVLWQTAGLGVLSVIPVLIVVSLYASAIDRIANPYWNGTLTAFFSAAVPEEFFKFLVVVLFAAKLRDFDEPMDGVVYGVAASLGFATIENILYVTHGGFGVAVTRALSSVPAHALFGAAMGLHVGRAKFDPAHRASHLAQGLGWAILLHGLYDTPLLVAKAFAAQNRVDEFPALWLLTVPVLIIGVGIWVKRLTANLRQQQLDPVLRSQWKN